MHKAVKYRIYASWDVISNGWRASCPQFSELTIHAATLKELENKLVQVVPELTRPDGEFALVVQSAA